MTELEVLSQRLARMERRFRWMSRAAIGLGIIATAAEILFGLLLLVGWQTRATAVLSGLLLLVFGVSMALGLGVKAPLNYTQMIGSVIVGYLMFGEVPDFYTWLGTALIIGAGLLVPLQVRRPS